MSLTKTRDRLIPSFHTGDVFAKALEERGVPIEGRTKAGKRVWRGGGNVNIVPRVCGEVYRQWIKPKGQFSSLKLATVADMARDAYVAEGGVLREALQPPDKRFTKFGVAAK